MMNRLRLSTIVAMFLVATFFTTSYALPLRTPSKFNMSTLGPQRWNVVLVEFEEDNTPVTTGNGSFLQTWEDSDYEYILDHPPHHKLYFQSHLKAISHYWRHVTHQALQIDTSASVILPGDAESVRLPHNIRYYHPADKPDSVDYRLAELVYEALRILKEDHGENSLTETLILFHAGVGQDFDFSDMYDPTPFDIPSFYFDESFLSEYLSSEAVALIQSLEKLIAKKRDIKQGAMQELLKPKEGWGKISFENAFDFLSTASYSRNVLNKTSETGYVHYGDIHTQWANFLDFKKDKLPSIDSIKAKAYPLLKEGDLIMADASEDYEGVGKSVEVRNLGLRKAISGLHTFLLRDKHGIFVNGFRGYISSCTMVKRQLDKLATGLKVYGISKNNLKIIKMPLPPKPEQPRMATILSDMNAEIVALETKLEKYKQIKQGMMQELLTGRIRLV